MVLCLLGETPHINTNSQWVTIMVTHLWGRNTTITGTGPLLHCPTLPSGIWSILTIQLQLWKMLLYCRGQVLHNYSKPLVVIMVPNPSPLVDTLHYWNHYHPSPVQSSAQRPATGHTPVGWTNAGPYHPTGCTSTHNPVYPPGV